MLNFRRPLFNFNHVVGYAMLAGLLFIIGHLIYLNGGQKMKNSIVCVDPYSIEQWNKSLHITQSVCVDIQLAQFEEMKDINSKEVQRWKDNYTWLKQQCNTDEKETNED